MQTRRLRYSLGKWGQKGSVDFEKEDWGNCYTLVLGVEEKCRVEPVCFLVVFCWFFLVGLFVFWGVFCDKKRRAFKSSLDLYFHPLIIEFFLLCPATIQSRWKDTKIIDVARGRRRWGGGGDFWRLFYPCGVNELHDERVCRGTDGVVKLWILFIFKWRSLLIWVPGRRAFLFF